MEHTVKEKMMVPKGGVPEGTVIMHEGTEYPVTEVNGVQQVEVSLAHVVGMLSRGFTMITSPDAAQHVSGDAEDVA